jgi:hypothetical protein
VISLGDSKKSLLLEIWLGLSAYGNYSIYIYYRGGDTEAECESAAWAALPEVAADTSTPVCYTNKLNRYHQIKWGTDAANEPFSVNSITFKYVPQGSY